MNIENPNVRPGQTESSGRTGAVDRTAASRPDEGRKSGQPETASEDRLELSNLSRALQAAAEDPPERAARVEQLRAEYARGEYDDDPAATARRIVEDTLGGIG